MNAVFVTVTPNPSVDRTIGVERVERGTVHHGTSSRIDPGGKGVNVARALAAHDVKSLAAVPVGGSEGKLLVDLLREHGVEVSPVPIADPIRGNVTITEPDGTTTKFNEPGPTFATADGEALLSTVAAALLRSPAWLVGCGRLPGGLGDDFYARLVHLGHRHGCRVAVDTSGEPLRLAAQAGADLLKPNLQELEEVDGRGLRRLGEVVAAAQRLLQLASEPSGTAGVIGETAAEGGTTAHGRGRSGEPAVIVSLGRLGAVLVRPGTAAVRAVAAGVSPVSTVGAGDALLAGYLHADATEWRDATPLGDRGAVALTRAVAWGTAAVSLPGSQMPGPRDVADSNVLVETNPDPELPIHE